MNKKQIANTAGELSKLFEVRTNDYPQWWLQAEIHTILVRNGIIEVQEEWWQK